jgi:hypothetical protein
MHKALFDCEIEFCPSRHLNHVYDGFWRLKKKGIINLKVKRVSLENSKPVIKVIVNNKHTAVYDALDGLNWTDGGLEENIEYIKSKIDCDFYFKRSFKPELQKYFEDAVIHPLGLYFSVDYEGEYPLTISEKLKAIVKQKIQKNHFNLSAYEYPPIKNPDNKILFLCGLWDPEDVSSAELKEQREQINQDRVNFVRACKAEFGDRFTGGIQSNDYSKKLAKDILVPTEITSKQNFLNAIKTHNICIASTGLHDSIGSKFGEYTAASRAIITEPLNYEVPGDFKDKQNYLSFNNTEELISNIQSLLNDPVKMQNMMFENYKYYNNYVNFEKMILNTLLMIHNSAVERDLSLHT